MRRGAFLPAGLIVPLATMYGLDPSKSQPMHFLITFLIGLVCAGVVVAITRNAVERRIVERSKTRLKIDEGRLVWTTPMGEAAFSLDTVSTVTVRQRRDSVRSIVLKFDNGRSVELQGFQKMNDLLESLRAHVRQESIEVRKWFQV